MILEEIMDQKLLMADGTSEVIKVVVFWSKAVVRHEDTSQFES